MYYAALFSLLLSLLCVLGWSGPAAGIIDCPECPTLWIDPPTNGRVLGPEIDCDNGGTGDCSQQYSNGTVVVLTAIPNLFYQVNTWSGVCSYASNATTCTVSMNVFESASVSFKPTNPRDKVGIDRNGKSYLDRDGDGIFDGATETLTWYRNSEVATLFGDWNGSGTTTQGAYNYRYGFWTLDRNGDGESETIGWGGMPEDVPVVGDWNGSGSTKIGIYRNGTWYIDRNGDGVWDGDAETIAWGGMPEDVPMVGRW